MTILEEADRAAYLREKAAGNGLLDRLARQMGINVERPMKARGLERLLREKRYHDRYERQK